MKRILIVEDDPVILKGLQVLLRSEHYDILTATDGDRGYQMAKRKSIDLIILDIMLPNKNGQDICRDLRHEGINTPILMLTSRKEEMDKVLGLELGADDYVTKPFSIRELLARIKVLLRRKWEFIKEVGEYTFSTVYVDFKKLEAVKNKKALKLSAKEFDVLKYLIQHEGEVITRDMLLSDVWGYDDEEQIPTTRTIDNYILSLRKKIEDDPSHPNHLLTIHTAGYKFVK